MKKSTNKNNVIDNNNTAATAATTIKRTTFEDIKNAHAEISLKKFCDTIGLCYQYILKVSKQPRAGEAYDATAINFEAIQRVLDKHTEIDLDKYDWSTIAEEVRQAKCNQPKVSKREDFKVGDKFTLRMSKKADADADATATTYEVIYMTATHIVFIDDKQEQPRVMNWDTFAHQSPRAL